MGSAWKIQTKSMKLEKCQFCPSQCYPLKLDKIRGWVNLIFDENVWFELLSMLSEK
jgi:hypothetical protein